MADQPPRIREALHILEAVGVPIGKTLRRKRRLAMTLLSLANLTFETPWSRAAIWEGSGSHFLTTRKIIAFWNAHFGEKVSSGSYDDVRRVELALLVPSGIVLRSAADPDANTNNPTRGYAIAPEASNLLRLYGKPGWKKAVKQFKDNHGVLKDRMERLRRQAKTAVRLPSGKALELSPGPHNKLQRAIIEEFLPRFVPGAEVLYVGDTTKKTLVLEKDRLKQLGFFELAHDALPDVVAYDDKRNWLILVEAVHSANPISQLRHLDLERLTAKCAAPRVYVSAFQSREALRDFLAEISWETEVWLVESPDHLIHFNGDKFLGPHLTPAT